MAARRREGDRGVRVAPHGRAGDGVENFVVLTRKTRSFDHLPGSAVVAPDGLFGAHGRIAQNYRSHRGPCLTRARAAAAA